MSQSSGTITTIFKSRQNLLKLLSGQGYDIKDYEECSVNETHVMFNNKQLDMMLSSQNNEKSKKVYVKYHLAKTLRRENINDYIDDLYNLEQVLSKDDTLIIVIKQEPHEPLLNILKQIWEQEGLFIMIYNLERLQYNILDHMYLQPANWYLRCYNQAASRDSPQTHHIQFCPGYMHLPDMGICCTHSMRRRKHSLDCIRHIPCQGLY